jgi:glycosyltransferase involved in cell wall biosynthesis
MSSGDEPYFEQVRNRVRDAGLEERVEFVGEVDRAGKIAFLHSLDVMSAPTVYHESKGISVIEALANGVPVVVPRHGAFPELIETTGGGLLCEPLDPNSTAAAIERLVRDPGMAADLGRRGYESVRRLHTAERMARAHLDLYRLLNSPQPTTGTRVATPF